MATQRDMDLWDVRIVERNLRRGTLSPKEHQKYLKKLPDVREKGIEVTEHQPLEPHPDDEVDSGPARKAK